MQRTHETHFLPLSDLWYIAVRLGYEIESYKFIKNRGLGVEKQFEFYPSRWAKPPTPVLLHRILGLA